MARAPAPGMGLWPNTECRASIRLMGPAALGVSSSDPHCTENTANSANSPRFVPAQAVFPPQRQHAPERLCALPLARYAIFPLSSIIAPSFLPRFDVRAAELQCPRLTGVSLQPRTRDTSGGRANLHSQPEISSGMSFSFLDLDPAASRPTQQLFVRRIWFRRLQLRG